ncbi:MAG: DUF423 domain-containing protein [Rhodospirillales bacterium]|nr:DUF423 domain-containing protein [Rhodospirillales bacterium]
MRLWLAVSAINGFIAVGMGAMAAHAFKAILPPDRLRLIETASTYQMWHALALLGVACLMAWAGGSPARPLQAAGWAFLAGIVLFSGSLYLIGAFGWRAAGMIAPIGGLALLAGWAALAVYAFVGRTAS